jgi:hypothetical protein
MRKYTVLAALCIAAFAAVPVASASAFNGTCAIAGNAELSPNLEVLPKKANFVFEGKAGTKCNYTENNEPKEATVLKAKVHGKGELACTVSESLAGEVEGSGEIELKEANGTTKLDTFEFKLVAVAGTVEFSAKGAGVNAAGAAQFLTSTKSLKECTNLAGAKELEFEAHATGEFS